MQNRPGLGVYRLTSCGGCQQALLDGGEALLRLARQADMRHFPEAGVLAPEQPVDIAIVDGSVSTQEDLDELQGIRDRAAYLISIGACATAGGIQALRNLADPAVRLDALYPNPEYLEYLANATPVSAHVRVDLELWGCPISGPQLLAALFDLLRGREPRREQGVLCLECQRRQRVCTLVARGEPCLGPLTRAGCGALCPSFGRACYACFGPAETVNPRSLGRRVEGLGLLPEDFVRRLRLINSAAPLPRGPTKGCGR